jgi:hypothetical protein
MPSKYTNVSLDEKLVKDLKKIHKKCLAPLGINYTAPSVIRHLVAAHNMSNTIQSELVHESILNWPEEADNE